MTTEVTDIKDIQKITLEIMKVIDTFCRANDIRYSMAGGTLLGALRHKGFIPWDDDADIIMPRPDYDRFVELFPKSGDKRYKMLDLQSGKGHWYKNCYCKVEDSYTICKDYGFMREQFGINVDIFPVDGAPDDPSEWKKLSRKVVHYKHRISHRQKPLSCLFHPHQGAPLAVLEAHMYPLEYWLDKCDSLIRERDFSTSKYAGALCGMYREREIFPREVFDSYCDYQFEDLKLMGLKEADTYLKGLYGDYMKLPPEADRHPGHHLKITLEIPDQDTL